MKTELSIIIRKANTSDLKKIQEIESASFRYPYPEFYMKALIEGLADIFLVAEIDTNIIGYITARVEYGYLGHIISIAIHPNWRRKGIGALLLNKCMEELKKLGCKAVYLEVRISNYPAISLYKKLGFNIERRVSRYYRDGEDAFVMARKL